MTDLPPPEQRSHFQHALAALGHLRELQQLDDRIVPNPYPPDAAYVTVLSALVRAVLALTEEVQQFHTQQRGMVVPPATIPSRREGFD